MPELEINLVQIPHPSKATFKFPPSAGMIHSQMPGREDVEASIWPV